MEKHRITFYPIYRLVMYMSSLFSIAFALFILMDPLGNVPLFLTVLKGMNPKKQRAVILRELFIALILIIGCYFIGDFFLNAIKVQEHTLLISGGIILFLVALSMIFPDTLSRVKDEVKTMKDPVIVPLAIPLIAGPAVLVSVMLYSQKSTNTWIVVGGIFLAWVATTGILLASSWLQKILGPKGLTALERLMGLLLTLISVQMILEGFALFLSNVHPI